MLVLNILLYCFILHYHIYTINAYEIGGFATPSADPSTQCNTGQQQIIVTQAAGQISFGPTSMDILCPNCQAHIMTATKKETGVMGYIAAGILCAIG